jgi:hypothetical protein
MNRMIPTRFRLATDLPPSRPRHAMRAFARRAGCAGGLRPALTAAAPDASRNAGRDEETAPFNRTKKHRGCEAADRAMQQRLCAKRAAA